VPVTTAVPTLTATLAPTLTPTLTLVPTATEIPTASPTPTATPEDFSDIPYAKTFKEAAVMEGTVTREDIESGRLLAYVKTFDVLASNESIPPAKVAIKELPGGFFDLNFTSPEGVEIVAVFPYDDRYGNRICIAFQQIPTDKGYGYLMYAFPVDSSKIGQMLLGWLNDQEVITPYYDSPNSRQLSKLIEETIAEGAKSRFEVDQIWVRDLPKVQALMRQWEETGVFPEELSSYPLEPLPID
jgi:hypothetical protein